MRLDQFLVQTNICSRSEAKKYIKNGRVTVNASIVRDNSIHIKEYEDVITFDGEEITYSRFHYYMLNKPQGCVSATRDGLSDTVIDLLKGVPSDKLFPVGRLDKDTEGLLLITDDGKLAHDLLSPKKHVDKTYYVRADGPLEDEAFALFESGIDIGDDKLTLPSRICRRAESPNSAEYELTIHEGRFHQVKRMFEACGRHVIFLKRLSMGSLRLDDNLEPGQFRQLTVEEINSLKN